jgi:hypothetical protein
VAAAEEEEEGEPCTSHRILSMKREGGQGKGSSSLVMVEEEGEEGKWIG